MFRTASATKLRVLLRGTVALEVDGLNPYATEVWSAVAKGRAQPFEEATMHLPEDDDDREPRELGSKLVATTSPTSAAAVSPSGREPDWL